MIACGSSLYTELEVGGNQPIIVAVKLTSTDHAGNDMHQSVSPFRPCTADATDLEVAGSTTEQPTSEM